MRSVIANFVMFSVLAAVTPGCTYLRETLGIVPQRPTVTIQDIQVMRLDFKELRLKVSFLVDNPNRFSLEFSDLNYVANLNDVEVAKGEYLDTMLFPAEDKKTITIPLSLNTKEALKIIAGTLGTQNHVRLNLVGTVIFHTTLGDMKVSFDDKRTLL